MTYAVLWGQPTCVSAALCLHLQPCPDRQCTCFPTSWLISVVPLAGDEVPYTYTQGSASSLGLSSEDKSDRLVRPRLASYAGVHICSVGGIESL